MAWRPKAKRETKPTPSQDRRLGARQRGYDWQWQQFAKRWLMDNPLCVACLKHDVVTAATDCDHIIPFRGNDELKWREGNHQSLCKACHAAKTLRESR